MVKVAPVAGFSVGKLEEGVSLAFAAPCAGMPGASVAAIAVFAYRSGNPLYSWLALAVAVLAFIGLVHWVYRCEGIRQAYRGVTEQEGSSQVGGEEIAPPLHR